ncbi:hypothetical protein HK104_005202, partial [Borealophlyctis nickersoniae]
MSAGTTCEVKISFRPPAGYHQDIENGAITFQAEHGGSFAIYIGCATRKCLPNVVAVGGRGITSTKLNEGGEDGVVGGTEEAGRWGEEWEDGEADVAELGSETHKRKAVARWVGPRKLVVDFGLCMVGDRIVRQINIVNDGAVSTAFEIVPVDGKGGDGTGVGQSASSPRGEAGVVVEDAADQKDQQTGTENPERTRNDSTPVAAEPTPEGTAGSEPTRSGNFFSLIRNEQGQLDAYSSQSIQIAFCPPYQVTRKPLASGGRKVAATSVRRAVCWYHIRFNQPGVEPIIVGCRAGSTEAPLMINREAVDFKLCLVDSVYRDRVILRNKHNTALKFWVELDGQEAATAQVARERSTREVSRVTGVIADASTSAPAAEPDNLPRRCQSPEEGSSSAVDLAPTSPAQSAQHAPPPAASKVNSRSDTLVAIVPTIGELEISPRLAFVQPYEPFSLWFKIRPSRSACALLDNGSHAFNVPITIRYVNHGVECPIGLTLRGRITTTDIDFETPDETGRLSFGACSIYETKSLPLKITNHSRLPQKVRLVPGHPALSVGNDDGPGAGVAEDLGGRGGGGGDTIVLNLHPSETATRHISFHPLEEGPHPSMRLICETVWDRKFEVKCEGVGVRPLLRFETNTVEFGNTAYGSESHVRVRILRDIPTEESKRAALRQKMLEKRRASGFAVADRGGGGGGNAEGSDDEIGFEFGAPRIVDCFMRERGEETGSAEDHVLAKAEIPSFLADTGNIVQVWPLKGALKLGGSMSIEVALTPPFPAMAMQADDHSAKGSMNGEGTSVTGSVDDHAAGAPAARRGGQPSSPAAARGGTAGVKEAKRPGRSRAPSGGSTTLPQPVLAGVTTTTGAQSSGLTSQDDGSGAVGKDVQPAAVAEQPIERSETEKHILSLREVCLLILIPCRMKKLVSEKARIQMLISGLADPSSSTAAMMDTPHSSDPSQVMYLKILAPVIRPDLILLPPHPTHTTPTTTTLDFSRVPVGYSHTLPLTLLNLTPHPLTLRTTGLNPLGPFYPITGLRPIPPHATTTMRVAFHPSEERPSQAGFKIVTGTTQVEVKMVGEGVVPRIDVEGVEDGVVYLGDVSVGEVGTKVVRVVNTGSVPVKFKVELAAPVSPRGDATGDGDVHTPRYGTLNFTGTTG